MARAPNVCGILDIRSWAFLHDVVEHKNQSAIIERDPDEFIHTLYVPDALVEATVKKMDEACRDEFEDAKSFESYYENPDGTGTEYPYPPPEETERRFKPLEGMFDTVADMVTSWCSFAIAATILGFMHSFAIMIPPMMVLYNLDYYEVVIATGVMYGLFICFGSLASGFIGLAGTRATCGLGMFLFFSGVILDSFGLERRIGFYISRALLALGGSFACTAAISTIADHLRKKLRIGLLIMSLACPVGTIVYYPLFHYFFHSGFSYKWIMTAYSILILILTSMVHLMPVQYDKYHSDPFNSYEHKEYVRHLCLDKSEQNLAYAVDEEDAGDEEEEESTEELAVNDEGETIQEDYVEDTDTSFQNEPCCSTENGGGDAGVEEDDECETESEIEDCECEDALECPDDEERGRSLICDCSMFCDGSFLVWCIASLLVVLPFYCTSLFLVCFTAEYKTKTDSPPLLMIWYCLLQSVGRVIIMLINDYSYLVSVIIFQSLLIFNAIMIFLFVITDTYGWIAMWAILGGMAEGAMMNILPKLTLRTVPRRSLYFGWCIYVLFCGIGVALGVVCIICSVDEYGLEGYSKGYNWIGITYLLLGVLLLLIPNEEKDTTDFVRENLTVFNEKLMQGSDEEESDEDEDDECCSYSTATCEEEDEFDDDEDDEFVNAEMLAAEQEAYLAN